MYCVRHNCPFISLLLSLATRFGRSKQPSGQYLQNPYSKTFGSVNLNCAQRLYVNVLTGRGRSWLPINFEITFEGSLLGLQ